MVRIKVENKSPGSVESEVVVRIRTMSGTEDVVVHVSQVDDRGIEVGHIGDKGEESLVELPRESLTGRWRVWVPRTLIAA